MTSGCRLVITCIAERQSYNAGLDFARLLAEMGHHVTFVGQSSVEHQKHVEANGFDFCGVGPPRVRVQKGRPIQRLKNLWAANQELNRAAAEFASRHANSFDLAFMDVNAGVAAHVLAKTGIPTIVFCSGYTSTFSLRYPPVNWCRRIPKSHDGSGWTERLANLFWWTYAIFRRRAPVLLRDPISLAVAWKIRRQTEKYGWRFCYGDWGVRPRIPEIAFAYKPIDWPVQQNSDTRLYLDRRYTRTESIDQDWHVGVDAGKPLVYCSLGAMLGPEVWKDRERKILYDYWRLFMSYLEVVINAFATRPEWQLLIAPGHLADGFDPSTLPPNVRVCRWVPQDEVLSQAAVAITAGGSATIRDCVRFGVPMLVFPAWSDHYGNAARVTYHKLGFDGGDFRKLTSPRLVALVESVMRDQEVASSMLAAKQSCNANLDTQVQDLKHFVERHTSIRL
jgi:zeaxanthin glucosyltransferase